jgi:hypothetical protein
VAYLRDGISPLRETQGGAVVGRWGGKLNFNQERKERQGRGKDARLKSYQIKGGNTEGREIEGGEGGRYPFRPRSMNEKRQFASFASTLFR